MASDQVKPPQPTSTPRDVPHRGPAKALIFAWGLLTLCFMPLVAIVLGSYIQGHWGTAFVIFVVPAAMELAPRGFWAKSGWIRVIPFFLLIQAFLLTLEYVSMRQGPVTYGKHNRTHFDAKAYATAIADPARAQLGGPIRVVSGSANPAGILAVQLVEKPLVLIDGRLDRSPWMSSGLVARCGAVELGFTESVDMPPADGAMPSAPEVSYARVRIDAADARPVGPMLPGLSWRVRRPEPGAAPCELR